MRTSANLFTENNLPTERLARLLRDLQLPGKTLPEIDDGLQAAFFQKKESGEGKERWELEKVTVTCDEHSIRDQLGGLGFMFRTTPKHPHYVRNSWPGGLVFRAAERLLDLIKAWESGVRWNENIVFGGKRELHVEKEAMSACINALQEKPLEMAGIATSEMLLEWGKRQPKTELDLMEWIWACSRVPAVMRELPTTFVDAPMKPPTTEGGKPVRPNTEDTIIEWLKTNPSPGSMLVSSGAPYGMAQNEAFWMLLGPKGHTVETFGHSVPQSLGLELLLRELAGTVNRIRRCRTG